MWHSNLKAIATSGVTGPDGQAHIPQPPADDTPVLYELAARGYLGSQTDQPAERTASGVVLEMFAEPRPVLELVVPNGYHGLIRASVSFRKDAPFALHQRLFSVVVPESGTVEAVLPRIFPRGSTPDIRTRYADGTPLSRTAKDYEVGCRWLMSDADSMYLFVIGTQWEADQVRRSLKNHSLTLPSGGHGATGMTAK